MPNRRSSFSTKTRLMHPVLLGFTILALSLQTTELGAAEQLSAVTVDRGNAARTLVGIIRSETPKLLLYDLRTNSEMEFEKSEVRRIRRDITEESAARILGVAPLLAWQLIDVLPEQAKSGKVATVDGRSVYVTFGKSSGIKPDDKLVVYRNGKPIINPDTGDVLGQERRKIGELLVTSVEEKYSKTLFATDIEVELQPGDSIEPESPKNALAIFPLVDQRAIVTKGGIQIAEELTGALVQRDVTVVERIRLLDAVKELNLQQQPSFDEKTVQKVGNHLGSFAILTGSITHARNESKVNIRLIEVATGKVLYARTFEVGKLDTTPAILFGPTSSTAPATRPPTNYIVAGEILTSPHWVWTKPGRYGPPINSDANEISPFISADGKTLLFASDRSGGEGGWDIWISERVSKSAPWNSPVNLGKSINSKGRDSEPCLSRDGLTLFFSSDRPGGEGELDIWMATRATTDSSWTLPTNLGPSINQSGRDYAPRISADGLSLYFSSTRVGTRGATDIWVSTRATPNSQWSAPENLGPGVNTSESESEADVTSDGLILLFGAYLNGQKSPHVLWLASRSSVDQQFGNRTPLPPPIRDWRGSSSPSVTEDGRLMVFRSNHSGSQGWDIWWTQRVPR